MVSLHVTEVAIRMSNQFLNSRMLTALFCFVLFLTWSTWCAQISEGNIHHWLICWPFLCMHEHISLLDLHVAATCSSSCSRWNLGSVLPRQSAENEFNCRHCCHSASLWSDSPGRRFWSLWRSTLKIMEDSSLSEMMTLLQMLLHIHSYAKMWSTDTPSGWCSHTCHSKTGTLMPIIH